MGAIRGAELAGRIAERRRGLLLAAAALLALVFVVWAWLRLVGPLPGDRATVRWWVRWDPERSLPPALDGARRLFDAVGTPAVAVVTVLVLAALFDRLLGRRWAALVVVAAAVVVLNATLKQLFGPTPLWVGQHNRGHNFPSGHVAYVTSLFGLLCVVALDRGRRAIAAACGAVIVIMGFERVVGETHLPSDVLAGYAVGGAWLCALLALGLPWALRDREG